MFLSALVSCGARSCRAIAGEFGMSGEWLGKLGRLARGFAKGSIDVNVCSRRWFGTNWSFVGG